MLIKFLQKYFLWVLILLMFVVLTYKYFILLNENKSLKNSEVNSQNKEQLYGLKQDIVWARELENDCKYKFVYDIELRDTLGNSFSFFDVISTDCVIYRIFENACESCINSTLEFIQKQNHPTLIMGSFYSNSSLKYYVKNFNLKCCYMIVGSNYITSSKLEENHIPYFFKVDASNCIIEALVPIRGFEAYSNSIYY